jgi:hypothetical protein
MSENLDEQIGQQGVEKRTWGAEPIYPDTPPEDILSPAEAAEKISEPRPEERPTIERDYIRRDPETGRPKRLRNEDGTFASEDGVEPNASQAEILFPRNRRHKT